MKRGGYLMPLQEERKQGKTQRDSKEQGAQDH